MGKWILWLENNWLTFRFALLTCPMKLSGGLGELEILEMVKLDFCILLWPIFSSKICFETLFVEYILPIYSRFEHTCVAYDKALAKYVVNTANLNATIADNTPRWNFFHIFYPRQVQSIPDQWPMHALPAYRIDLQARLAWCDPEPAQIHLPCDPMWHHVTLVTSQFVPPFQLFTT